MIVKAFEIRDAATFIPALAVKMVPTQTSCAEHESERYLLRRAGFNFESPHVILCRMEAAGTDRNATYDPFSWGVGSRTMALAHQYLEKHFDELESGAVIDVEFILGQSTKPKVSERVDDCCEVVKRAIERTGGAVSDQTTQDS